MITYLSTIITDFLISSNKELLNEREIYKYGIEIIISSFLNILIVLICGLFFKMLFESILYFLVFAVMRCFCGGYHANTYFKCNLILFIVVLISFFLVDYLYKFDNFVIVLTIISFVTLLVAILLFAPLEHKDKPLTKNAKITLRRKSIILYIIILIFWIIIFCINKKCAVAITFSLISVMLSLIIGKFLKNKEVNVR